jgi:hypothetical protein
VSGETTTRDPATASDKLHTGFAQQEIRSYLHDRPDDLRKIPWRRARDAAGKWQHNHPGVGEMDGSARTALINSFMEHNIPIQVRLDLDAARRFYDDPDLTELTIAGPNPMAWALPQQRLADASYTITGEWRDFNAWFANDLNYRAAEDVALGAPYQKMGPWRKVMEDGGVPVLKREPVDVPATALFEWRTVADMEAGELPSGLVVSPHTAAARRLLADEPPPPEAEEQLAAQVGEKKGARR